jgi:peptidoglycan/LPS O-acetylase OafA/YrhL
MSFAREAVALFIVLSGFCLMLPVVRHGAEIQGGAWQFFKRRARRILPPYYFALAISLLLIWTVIGQKTNTHWDASLPADGKAIWTHLLLLQDVFQDTSARINHVMWSISVEWRIYFLFPSAGPVLASCGSAHFHGRGGGRLLSSHQVRAF